MTRLFTMLSFCAALLAGTIATAGAQSSLETLRVVTRSGPHDFSVEVMRTEPERERGLMGRRYLPEDRGMLFDFKAEQPVSMWMKNTFLPLDMVFIDRAGRVVRVAEAAEPMSETIIPSGGAVLGVLELNAGVAAKIGLRAGDVASHPLFKP